MIPIITTTTKKFSNDVFNCLKLPFNTTFVKFISLIELLESTKFNNNNSH